MTRGLVVGVLAAIGLAWSWSTEHQSLERANRLFRAGRAAEAIELYEARARAEVPTPELRFNLGTALMNERPLEAEIELARAALSGDTDIRGRAHYNTGLLRLRSALDGDVPDSVRINAAASVGENRLALRMQPESQDARWNLAMALRLLDSIDAIERRSGRELTEGAVEADVVTRSVNVPDAAEDEHADDPPAEGESEAVAVRGDESPLTLEEAMGILGRTHRDATQLLGKLLALESRSRWGRRPSRSTRRW